MNIRMLQLILFSAIFLSLRSFGQNFTNIKAEFIDGDVEVTYDLIGESGEEYRVELRNSLDDYTSVLRSATGDVGEGIQPGENKKIIWDADANLPENFDGSIQFKLTGELTFKPSADETTKPEILQPGAGSSFRRGKAARFVWKGVDNASEYRLELYKGEQLLANLNTFKNEESYTWNIPIDTKTGKDYSIKLVNTTGPGSVESGDFKIAPKIPLWLKIVPIAVVGGAAAALSGGSDSGPGPGGTNGGDDALPIPPDPE